MLAEFNTGVLSDYCLVHLACAGSDLPSAFSSTVILCGKKNCQRAREIPSGFSVILIWQHHRFQCSTTMMPISRPTTASKALQRWLEWHRSHSSRNQFSLRQTHWFMAGWTFDVSTILDVIAQIQMNQTRHIFPILNCEILVGQREFQPQFPG